MKGDIYVAMILHASVVFDPFRVGVYSVSIEDKTEEPDRCPFDFTLGIIED